jgi:hypothetical protein
MADVAILDPSVEAAPSGYTIPGAQEIILKSVKASYDGSGASGDYVPTLQFVAPNGTIVAECPLLGTVTAGDDVDMTWFPRGGVAASSGGITEVTSPGGTIYVTNPTGPIVDIDLNTTEVEVLTASQSIPAGTTADVTFAHDSGSVLTSLATATEPAFLANGIYNVNTILAWSPAAVTVGSYGTFATGGILGLKLQNLGFGTLPLITAFGGFTADSASGLTLFGSGQKIVCEVGNTDAVHAQTLGVTVIITQLGLVM